MVILRSRVIPPMAIRHIDLLTDNHLLLAHRSIRTNVIKWLRMQSDVWASGDANLDEKTTQTRIKGKDGVRKPPPVFYFHAKAGHILAPIRFIWR